MCHYSGILSTVFNRYFLNFKAHLFLARILMHYLEQTFCIILCDTSTSVIDGVEYTQSFFFIHVIFFGQKLVRLLLFEFLSVFLSLLCYYFRVKYLAGEENSYAVTCSMSSS